ncbi:hypothetical protein AHAS_Ahas01G0280900 [Arachis hypogaea]
MSTSRPARNFDVPAPVPAPAPASASADHAAGTTPAHLAATVCASRIDQGENIKKSRRRQSATLASTEEHSVNAREFDLDSLGFRLLEEDAQGIDEIPNPTPIAAARGGASSMKGPVDLFVKRPETAIARNKKKKLRQQNIKKACNKKAVHRVHRYITR